MSAQHTQAPVAWIVWWGISKMRPHDRLFDTEAEAKAFARQIKSNTEVLPVIYNSPAQISPDAEMRNAERYRWLREASWNGGLGIAGRREKSRSLVYKDGTGDTLFQIYFWGAPKQLDEAIDAAIAKAIG